MTDVAQAVTHTHAVSAERDCQPTAFDCNICHEQAQDPVVTLCGHLYCWPCLYRWLGEAWGHQSCPVCKAGVEADKVIPLYGRGCDAVDPRNNPIPQVEQVQIPRRPLGQRPPLQRIVNHDGTYSVAPSLLASLLGYQQAHGAAAHRDPLTPEQQHQAFLSRLLLMLGSFVIMCLLLF